MEKYTGYVMLEVGRVDFTGVCQLDAVPQGALLIPEANVSAVQYGDEWDNYTTDGTPKPYQQLIEEGKLRLVDVDDALLDARDRLRKQAMLGLGNEATEDEIQVQCDLIKLRETRERNLDYIQRKEAEAERQAINELIATRKAEILAEMEKATDNSISRARESAEACSREALALTNQQGEEGLKN